MALGADPYAVLGVPSDATNAQIAQAWRRLSRAYDPGRGSAPDAAARFAEVQHAFELLSDPGARAEHDQLTAEAQGAPVPPQPRSALRTALLLVVFILCVASRWPAASTWAN